MENKKTPLTVSQIEQHISEGKGLEELLKQLGCSNVSEFKKLESKLVSNKKMTGFLKKLRKNQENVNFKTNFTGIYCINSSSSEINKKTDLEEFTSHKSSKEETNKTDNTCKTTKQCSCNTSNFVIESAKTVETIDDNEYIIDNINIEESNTLEKELDFYENYAVTLSCEMEKVQTKATIQLNKLSEMKDALEKMLQEVNQRKKEIDNSIETFMLLKTSEQKYKEEQEHVATQIVAIKNEIARRNQVYLVFDADVQSTDIIGKKILYEQESKKIPLSEFNKIFLENICREEMDDFKISSLKKMAYIIAICNKYEGIKILINDDELIKLCKIMNIDDFVVS